MTKQKLINWLTHYYLVFTLVVGMLLILLGPKESIFSLDDLEGIYSIIIPVLFGQLTIIYNWFSSSSNNEKEMSKTINLSEKFVKIPLIGIAICVFICFLLRGLSINLEWSWVLSESQFKWIISLSMALLNATIFILVVNLFKVKEDK